MTGHAVKEPFFGAFAPDPLLLYPIRGIFASLFPYGRAGLNTGAMEGLEPVAELVAHGGSLGRDRHDLADGLQVGHPADGTL